MKEIISALMDWNPWLEGRFPEKLMGMRREYDLGGYLSIPEIKILEGVRRSGKSTLLYQVVQYAQQEKKAVLYVNFDDEVLKKYALSEIYYAFLEHHTADYLLIDEIQQCKDWVPFIRKMYDRRELEQIWITGSNSSLIKKEYAELLTGRNIKLNIHTLSFREFLNFKGLSDIKLPSSKKQTVAIKSLFEEYLGYGSFPAIALRDVYKRELLNNYFEDFLFKDIATRYDVNTNKLKDLAIFLASNSGKLFSYRKISQALRLHTETVTDYVNYMKDVFLFDEINKYDFSLKKQMGHDKKIYMIDTGLANAMSFRFSEDKGRILETLVYQQLKRLGKSVYFHRGKKECDFLTKVELEIETAIQVTCSIENPDTREREIAGLVDAIKTYKTKKNLILTLDESKEIEVMIDDAPYKIEVKPVWEWLL